MCAPTAPVTGVCGRRYATRSQSTTQINRKVVGIDVTPRLENSLKKYLGQRKIKRIKSRIYNFSQIGQNIAKADCPELVAKSDCAEEYDVF